MSEGRREDVLATLRATDEPMTIVAIADELDVHPNTVRYRLKRIAEATGFSPLEARDAYALRLALTVGRLEPGGPAA